MLLLSDGATGFINATDRLPQTFDFTHSATVGDIDHDGDVDIIAMNIWCGHTARCAADPAIHFDQ